MEKHTAAQIAPNTWHIEELGTVSMYLLEGETHALLIDAACGLGDLPGMIRSLTEKPLLVACTHGHLDHVGGLGHFQEAYVHPKDMQMIRSLKAASLRLGALVNGVNEKPVPINRALQLHEMTEGFCFELGGRTVRVIELPGHTPGSVGFIDSATGFLFSGDACNHNLLLAYPLISWLILPPGSGSESVETALGSLKKLSGMRAEFDANYTGHLHEINYLPAPPETLDDCIACCEEILTGTARQEKPAAATVFDKRSYRCASHGIVKVTYSLNNLRGS